MRVAASVQDELTVRFCSLAAPRDVKEVTQRIHKGGLSSNWTKRRSLFVITPKSHVDAIRGRPLQDDSLPSAQLLENTTKSGFFQAAVEILDRGQELVDSGKFEPATELEIRKTEGILNSSDTQVDAQTVAQQPDQSPKEGLIDSSNKLSSSDSVQKEGQTLGAKLSDAMSRGPPMQFWDDWVDPSDMAAMWSRPAVALEWRGKGFQRGSKVLFTRDERSKPYLTMAEMQGVAEIIIDRHFRGRVNLVMLCAIAEIESDRRPLAYRFEPALGEASTGLMQVLQSTAEWLARDMGYRAYSVNWASEQLYRPFAAVYFGGAYLNWLSTYKGVPRSEEFIVRGYNGGPNGVNLEKTVRYWSKYLVAKAKVASVLRIEAPQLIVQTPAPLYAPPPSAPGPVQAPSQPGYSIPPAVQAPPPTQQGPGVVQVAVAATVGAAVATSIIAGPAVGMWAATGAIAGALGGAIANGWPPPRREEVRRETVEVRADFVEVGLPGPMTVIVEEETGPVIDTATVEVVPEALSTEWVYWDDVVTESELAAMWAREDIRTEWTAAGEKPGRRVRFSRDAQKRPFLTAREVTAVAEITVQRHFRGEIDPSVLAALAEVSSKRLLYGRQGTGLMETELETVLWLASCNPRYAVYPGASLADLSRPFVSVFYGAAYVHWLSKFEGKSRSEEFVVRGYCGGPNGSSSAETLPFWQSYRKVKGESTKQSWWR
ncbi:hypothetical protein KFL_000100200 [Klebsormidium nitens]|uniref:Transglycosylase SLT domain-containing protein n=1 Tax=Klebsormidium nitens TaxID=105231 RepID=A0A1Y1HIE5_KLENI|nr:hypothetical protein KFL_000100200 [Klebsormidium nitens]|eukprot:GAQ78254.1 hypothetical protein KFL_000100200 [Klebsormidium nitens]